MLDSNHFYYYRERVSCGIFVSLDASSWAVTSFCLCEILPNAARRSEGLARYHIFSFRRRPVTFPLTPSLSV